MKAFGLTDVGLKRNVNQDAFYLDNENQIYIVADGMGGHKAGDLASRTALDAINEYLALEVDQHPDVELKDEEVLPKEKEICADAVKYANQMVFEKSNESPDYQGMGTTVVVLKIVNGHAIFAHVGDSRIYRIQDEKIEQLTKDHSRLQELIDQEKISEDEARKYPLKNVITRALGGSADVEVDTGIVALSSSDVFVLCTDGLSGVMSDDELLETISSNPGDPEEACRRLVQITLDRGAPDNVTLIIGDTRAYSGGEPESDPPGPTPSIDADRGGFRRFIDKWFKG